MAERLAGSHYKAAEASPGFLFWKTFNSWSRQLRVELEKIELTQVQYSILAATSYLGSSSDNVTQQDISNQLSMDKMMVSDVVKLLERRKLMIRKPHPTDGRSWTLSPTAAAKSLLKTAVPIVEAVDESFFGALSADQRKRFIECMLRLLGGGGGT